MLQCALEYLSWIRRQYSLVENFEENKKESYDQYKIHYATARALECVKLETKLILCSGW